MGYKGVLYNRCYGGFGFSGKFMTEYKKRLEARGLPPLTGYIWCKSLRMEPLAIELFLEHGSKWCSDGMADIGIKYVHPLFADSVHVKEYDGNETVTVDSADVYRHLLKTFLADHKDHTVADITQLKKQVAELEAVPLDQRVVSRSQLAKPQSESEDSEYPESTSDTE